MSSEHAVQVPAEIAGLSALAIALAEQPIAAAFVVLDAEIVAHAVGLARSLPPFAMYALGAVGADHAVGLPTPGEAAGGMIGQLRQHVIEPFRAGEQARGLGPFGVPGMERGAAVELEYSLSVSPD